ncbi:conserved hypothetical protein [Desulfovibrionales bacterium]
MSTTMLEGATRTADGIIYNGIIMQQIVEKCYGCERIREFDGEKFCSSYPAPSAKWTMGVCNFATHMKATIDTTGKIKINPLKASKRAARGR